MTIVAPNLFDRLLAEHPGSQIDVERFWIVVEHLREQRLQPNLSCHALLAARYAPNGAIQRSLGQIGKSYGITRERVRQKEGFAVRQLRVPAVFRMYAYRRTPAEMRPLEFPLPRPPSPPRPRPSRSRRTKTIQ